MAKKDDRTASGVRGPGGPPAAPRQSESPARARVERLSVPLLIVIQAVPRWIMVVLPAVMLFGGLVVTGPWTWVGWLLLLSWPALKPGSRYMRLLVVIVIFGLAWLKASGRF